ncbi:MAG: polymorphic toxin type 47 domain-containing protein [Spirochaetota bacterium]
MFTDTQTKLPTISQSTVPKKPKKGKGYILFLVFLILSVITVILNQSKLTKFTVGEERELANLEERMQNKILLKDWEKERYCELLNKIKGIKLFACKENYFCNVGSLTGYTIQSGDVDLRETGISFADALKLAFAKTGVDVGRFQASKWAKDLNGKSGVVEWRTKCGAEVSIDSPHTKNGPDVFHIGYKTCGKRNRQIGHIFLDCVPYFRDPR